MSGKLVQEHQIESGTGIIGLLVPLCVRRSNQKPLQRRANFTSRAGTSGNTRNEADVRRLASRRDGPFCVKLDR